MKARQMNPIESFLSRLSSVRRGRKGWSARCPAHEDRRNSLSVGVGDDGRVLLKCFAGCQVESIVRAISLEMYELFERAAPENARGEGGRQRGGKDTATVQPPPVPVGLTLAQYAQAKRLPVEFLRSLGLSEIRYLGQPAVRIPYLDREGTEVAVRFRLALDGDHRFCWKRGAKPCLYGLQRLEQARKAGYVIANEGESDTQTCWLHDIPAVGIPGASMSRVVCAADFEGITTVYVIVEPDQGGEATRNWAAGSSPPGQSGGCQGRKRPLPARSEHLPRTASRRP